MDIKNFSTKYQVKQLDSSDVNKVFALVQNNSNFFNYCPPQPTRHSILEDMQILPANKTADDKFYLGFFDDQQLVAVMDLVTKYPDDQTAWMGLFIVDAKYQNKGVGSAIISEVTQVLHQSDLKKIELAYPRGNAQSEHFLLKNAFVKTGQEVSEAGYTVVVMERAIL
ncbi:GNAT family N-acetyltransferase [Companilactobacillus kimchiensis]|uniref:GCN5-related N-acetyltransferase n=1 Tax=Companilactobacillus kimchiensis TaxID=993692 RepID=A0A0R2L945_9LACO|nr:GNAT family N-acetyltransferase [Companilactobacillus kimchiensis]KRN98283.1 GCN5-related N-acetyltransferase [Companilactobacillus kimchiensis]